MGTIRLWEGGDNENKNYIHARYTYTYTSPPQNLMVQYENTIYRNTVAGKYIIKRKNYQLYCTN